MTDRADRARSHLEFLVRQVAELEALATAAVGGEDPQIGAAVSARGKAAELQKKIEQLRDWIARQQQPPTAKRGKHTAKRPQALLLIAAGHSTTEVAAQLDLDRRTINRWRADPEFDEELRELVSEQTDALHALLISSQLDVARCLVGIATGPDTSDIARVQAARVYFELLGRHKGAPVAPTDREGEIETEADVEEALKDIPDAIFQRVMEKRAAARAAKAAAKKPRRAKAKDL